MIEAWVDGSFTDKGDVKVASWAFVVVDEDEAVFEDCGNKLPEEFLEHRNVAGEVFAVTELLNFCIENQETEVTIHYDYEGLEKWATGAWKTNKQLTQEYKQFVKDCGIKINWVKVQGHSGDKWNEYADKLAKTALENLFIPGSSDSAEILERNTEMLAEIEKGPDFEEFDNLMSKKKYMEASMCLKPFISPACDEELFRKYISVIMTLGDFYAKKSVLMCEKYLENKSTPTIMMSYVYALFYAYIKPSLITRDYNVYMEGKKAVKKILSITKNQKIVNELIYPFVEHAGVIGDKFFFKMLPTLVPIDTFSKNKIVVKNITFPSNYDRVNLLIKINKFG